MRVLLSDLNKKLALLRSHVLHLQEEEGEAEEEEETPHAHASMHQAEFSEHPEVPPQGPPTQEFVGELVGEFVRGAASGECWRRRVSDLTLRTIACRCGRLRRLARCCGKLRRLFGLCRY